jgi:hypothetical protein
VGLGEALPDKQVVVGPLQHLYRLLRIPALLIKPLHCNTWLSMAYWLNRFMRKVLKDPSEGTKGRGFCRNAMRNGRGYEQEKHQARQFHGGKLERGDDIALTERMATIICSCCVSLIAPLVRVEMYVTLEISAVVNAQEVVIAAARALHAHQANLLRPLEPLEFQPYPLLIL